MGQRDDWIRQGIQMPPGVHKRMKRLAVALFGRQGLTPYAWMAAAQLAFELFEVEPKELARRMSRLHQKGIFLEADDVLPSVEPLNREAMREAALVDVEQSAGVQRKPRRRRKVCGDP